MLEKHQHHHDTRDFDGITDNRASKIPWYFSALFFGLLIWGGAYMGYYLFSGWTQEGEFGQKMAAYEATHRPESTAPATAPPSVAQPTQEELLAKGATLYGKRCRACHGAEGKGGVGTDLTQAAYHYGRDLQSVTRSIAGGRPGGMPAFGEQLSAGEIQALAAHVLSLE
ncbi:MAG TPA: c-type cytochrome [Deferrisomatales bacterium]|nr:c-type cytochrome [Deferrisomatales bacterium]